MSTLQAPAAISVVIADVLTDFLAVMDGETEQEIIVYGPQDEPANNPDPPCIAWSLGEEKWLPGQHAGKPGSPSTLYTRSIPITVEIFGGVNPAVTGGTTPPSSHIDETDRTEAMMASFVNSWHRRLTQNGGGVLAGGWSPSKRMGIGMVYVLVLELRLPLVREDNPTVTVKHINVTTELDS